MELPGTRTRIRRYLVSLVVPVLILLGTASCYFDNEEELYAQACNDPEVSFRDDILPIMRARCYNCHDVTNAPALGDNIVLEGYANIYDYVIDNPGRFEGSVTWDGSASPMPQNDTKLDFCSINRIVQWIEQGSKNN